jgi:hypothetical protein
LRNILLLWLNYLSFILHFLSILIHKIWLASALPLRMSKSTIWSYTFFAKLTDFIWPLAHKKRFFLLYLIIFLCLRLIGPFLVFKSTPWPGALCIEFTQCLRLWFIEGLFLFMIKHAFLFISTSFIILAKYMLEATIFFGEPLRAFLFELTDFLFLNHYVLL